MLNLTGQLDLLGLDETKRRAVAEGATPAERKRLSRRVEVTHEMLSELPTAEDLSFLHSGLCQTCLPHSRPAENHAIWRRRSGRFSLLVQPGAIDTGDGQPRYVGVPYGPKARLILIHLQTEGMRSRTVSLGPSLSAFLRSLGLSVSGGPRGSIGAIREQSLRIARCSFTMQWTDTDAAGGERTVISDTRLVDGLELWRATVLQGSAGSRSLSISCCRYGRRTYSGRPSSSIRFSASTAMPISVARRRSVRDRRPSPITRLKRLMSASTRARQL